ncbi:MAG: TrmH family RNA methyltransferase [candidate division SR1 bacterium]|nr:TrmH family RNA methyltransferase [candidate division SR1 bacterium]
MKIVILENIRSAYNVGNIIRTADALGWQVRLSGYTPSPVDNKKVIKTSLGAEETVGIRQFDSTADAMNEAKKNNCIIIAAEITPEAITLSEFSKKNISDVAVVFGNEVDGVLSPTLKTVDHVVYVPMKGIKESINVGQTSAIFMRALS